MGLTGPTSRGELLVLSPPLKAAKAGGGRGGVGILERPADPAGHIRYQINSLQKQELTD